MTAKKKNIVPEIPEEFRQRYKSEYACFPISWRKRVEELPDDIAGRLLKAVLAHCELGSSITPDGMDAFAFGLVLDKVDEYQEKGLEFAWARAYKAHIAAQSRWDSKDGEGVQVDAQGCSSIPKNSQGCHNIIPTSTSTSTSTSTTKGNSTLQPSREETREEGIGWDWIIDSFLGDGSLYDADLSGCLSSDEEEQLTEGPGNYDKRITVLFCRSSFFDPNDTIDTKSKKMMSFVDAFNDALNARRRKIEAPAPGTANKSSSSLSRAASEDEVRAFCEEKGFYDFDYHGFFCEMVLNDWQCWKPKNDTVEPVRNWRKLVEYRSQHPECNKNLSFNERSSVEKFLSSGFSERMTFAEWNRSPYKNYQ